MVKIDFFICKKNYNWENDSDYIKYIYNNWQIKIVKDNSICKET